MKKFINSDYFLVSVSILVSILLWIFVTYEINPVYEIKVDNVKIAYNNKTNDFKTGKLVVVDETDLDADVVVRGERGAIAWINGADINCTVSLASITNPGTYVLPVSYSTNVYGVNIVKKNPATIEVVVDKVITRELEIVAFEKGNTADGYGVRSIVIEPYKVRVTGPQSYVEKIEKAGVSVDVTDAKADIKGLYKVKLYDENGSEIHNEHIKFDVEYCDVLCKVEQCKDVKVVAHIGSGTNYSGDSVNVLKLTPETIRLYGEKEKLDEIKRIDTYEINVSNVYGKTEVKAKLDLSILPDGVTVDKNITEVTVELNLTSDIKTNDETQNGGK